MKAIGGAYIKGRERFLPAKLFWLASAVTGLHIQESTFQKLTPISVATHRPLTTTLTKSDCLCVLHCLEMSDREFGGRLLIILIHPVAYGH